MRTVTSVPLKVAEFGLGQFKTGTLETKPNNHHHHQQNSLQVYDYHRHTLETLSSASLSDCGVVHILVLRRSPLKARTSEVNARGILFSCDYQWLPAIVSMKGSLPQFILK